jgi:hypothetical protein
MQDWIVSSEIMQYTGEKWVLQGKMCVFLKLKLENAQFQNVTSAINEDPYLKL